MMNILRCVVQWKEGRGKRVHTFLEHMICFTAKALGMTSDRTDTTLELVYMQTSRR